VTNVDWSLRHWSLVITILAMALALHVIDARTDEDMLCALADLAGTDDEVVSVGPPPPACLSLPIRPMHRPFNSAFLCGRRMQDLADRARIIHAWSPVAARAVAGLTRCHCGVVVSVPSARQADELGLWGQEADAWPNNLLLTVPSDCARQLVLSCGLSERAVKVLPPPGRAVDHQQAVRARVRAELGLNDDHVLLAAPLPMEREAGQIEAAWVHAIVWHIHSHTRLVLPGLGPGEPHARHFAKTVPTADYVYLTGRSYTRREVLAAADIALFLAPTECGLGGLADAMAAGVPIVATRNPEYDSLLADGLDAVLVPPRVIRTMADGVLRVLDDGDFARGLAAAAARKARRLFDVSLARQALEDVYQAVAPAPQSVRI